MCCICWVRVLWFRHIVLAMKGSPAPMLSVYNVDAKEEVATLAPAGQLEYSAVAMSRCGGCAVVTH